MSTHFDPVIIARRPEGVECEWPCNCHPTERRPTAIVTELGNVSSSHKVLLCAESVTDLRRKLVVALTDGCTGIAARWCPIHGDCTCPWDERTGTDFAHGEQHGCPLHGPVSDHGQYPGEEAQ